MQVKVWRKGNTCVLWQKFELVQLLWKMVWRVLKSLKIKLPCDPVMPHLYIYLKKKENTKLKRYMHPHVYYGFPDSSVGKESVCSAGDPGSIPGYGRCPWGRDRLPTPVFLVFPYGSADKESACNVGDLALIPGLGRCPGERKGYPIQYSGPENSMDSIYMGP